MFEQAKVNFLDVYKVNTRSENHWKMRNYENLEICCIKLIQRMENFTFDLLEYEIRGNCTKRCLTKHA